MLYSQKWERMIGLPNNYEASRRVIEHYDMGYLLSAQHGENGWVIKSDINGNVLWSKVIGNYPDKVATEKTVYDDQGNMYIFGLLVQNIQTEWPLAIKLNACGELEWCKQLYFGDYEYGYFYDVILLENGDLLAVANMPDSDQYDQIFLFYISSDGEFKWKQSYASKANYPKFENRLGSRIQFFDDIYIISGYVYSPHPNYPTVSSIRPMFIGINTDFKEEWVLQFGLEDNMKGKALTSIAINDSLFMGVGRYRYGTSSGETKDAWAMFYNDKGQQIGYQVITTDKLGSEITESTFFEVERVTDNIFVASSGFIYGNDERGAMGEIVFDTAGHVYNFSLRENTTGGNPSIVKTYDNKYVIACTYRHPNSNYDVYLYKVNDSLEHDTIYPGNYTYDSLCPYAIKSGVIDLAGCDVVTGIGEIPTLEEYRENMAKINITAIPNPSSTGEVVLEFENTSSFTNMQLRVFDAFGREIHSETVYPHQGASRLDVCHWPPGLYLAVVYSNGGAVGRCKVVVE